MTPKLAFNLLSATCIGLATLFGLLKTASIYADLKNRETIYEFIEDAVSEKPETSYAVTWAPAIRETDRPVTPFDQDKIGKALSEAWIGYAKAMRTGETAPLSNSFSSIALARSETAAVSAFENGTRMVVLDQEIRPSFFHLDGSIFQTQSRNLTLRFNATDEFVLSKDVVTTTMTNGANGWRIFSHELRDVEMNAFERPKPKTLQRLKGINYYPSKTPWSEFWSNYDRAVIEKDFALVKSLGANSVRVFLPFQDFSNPKHKAENLERLSDLLRRAEDHKLSVIPTLFDLKPDFRPEFWPQDIVYMRDVLDVLSQSQSIAFVDLKNEPDLDFGFYGQSLILTWAKAMVRIAQTEYPHLLWSIGWSNAKDARHLMAELDIISYHDYEGIEDAETRLENLRSLAGGKQVFVTEIGVSSYAPLFSETKRSLAKQAKLLERRLDTLAKADGIFIWTLHDFVQTDDKAIAPKFWIVNTQKRFGLLTTTGDEKPAVEVVKNAY